MNNQDKINDLLRAVEQMTRAATVGEISDGCEEDLRSVCACIAALGETALATAKAGDVAA